MNHVTKGALSAAAAGVALLSAAGTFAFATFESVRGVLSVGRQEWSVVIVVLGLVGYAAAILVAALGRYRPRHVRS